MATIYSFSRQVVSTTRDHKSLRNVIRHAGKYGLHVVVIKARASGLLDNYPVNFYFYPHDGSPSEECTVGFADWRALIERNMVAGRNLRPERLTVTEEIYQAMHKETVRPGVTYAAAVRSHGTIITVRD
jgi:hypothetical protein